MLVNRVDRRDDIGTADMEKLFGCRIHASLPSDYFALHRVVTLGQPLGADGELGRAIETVSHRLCESLAAGKKPAAPARELKPALTQA